MPHSFGYRARTRDLFSKPFRKNGPLSTQIGQKVYKVGQIVDIKGDGSIHKGMPHKFYHGKTGIVWNVTKRAVGVEVNKLVGNRIMAKRVHLRVQHVKHSTSRKDFLDRVTRNEKLKNEAKKEGRHVDVKRKPEQPIGRHFVKGDKVQTMNALRFVGLYQ
mmetsp:Transcript_17269/g.19298  ORF Transcript_17269/g.19298 Transcript_17269/m.19298 type:complete len:160 (+) Transcript_17269:32-511(+)